MPRAPPASATPQSGVNSNTCSPLISALGMQVSEGDPHVPTRREPSPTLPGPFARPSSGPSSNPQELALHLALHSFAVRTPSCSPWCSSHRPRGCFHSAFGSARGLRASFCLGSPFRLRHSLPLPTTFFLVFPTPTAFQPCPGAGARRMGGIRCNAGDGDRLPHPKAPAPPPAPLLRTTGR